MNSVNLVGNLTRDIDLVYTQSGVPIANLGVAVNNRTKRGEDWVDEPCFIDVTVFGKRAEWLAGNLTKGTKVGVSGKLVMDQWEDRTTGQKRSKVKIIGDITLLGRQQLEGQQPNNYGQNAQYSQPSPAQQQSKSSFVNQVSEAFGGTSESDVPF